MKLTSNEAKNILESFRGKTESDRWIEHCISVGNSAGKIAKAGKYNMTINMMDYTHEITEAPTELYMTGSEYSWGGVWKQQR